MGANMKLIRNICSICRGENFLDTLYSTKNAMCNECVLKLHTKKILELRYTIIPKVSAFEKFIFNLSQTKIYILKVELKDETKSPPPFKLLGSKLNFPSDLKNTKVLCEVQKPLSSNIYQAEILVNEILYCKLFIEDIYKTNIIHPSNKSLKIGASNV